MKKNFLSRNIILAGLMAAMTAAGAFIKIPWLLVPMTMQTFFSSLAGLILSPFYAALSQFVYLLLGLLGFPIFVQGGGIGYIFQPTFGYLLSLPVAAYSLSYLVTEIFPEPKFSFYLIFSLLINLFTLAFGTIWLFFNINYYIGFDFSWKEAIFSGTLIFLPGTLIKAVLASYFALSLRKRFPNITTQLFL